MEEKDVLTNETQQPKHAKKRTLGQNLKIAGATIGIVAALVGVGYGTIAATGAIESYKEGKVVESIITQYIDTETKYCEIDESVEFTSEYDKKIASGSTLAKELQENGVKLYCENGKYYSQNGGDYAIVTVTEEKTVTIEAIKIESNGTIMYMAPTGYELEGNVCKKVVTEEKNYIVPTNENKDYKYLATNENAQIEVKEVSTLPYSEMENYDWVCEKDTQANEQGLCEGTLKLVKR